MDIIYTELTDEFGNKTIQAELGDGLMLFIPTDPANSDYQRYLRWLENPDAEENDTLSQKYDLATI